MGKYRVRSRSLLNERRARIPRVVHHRGKSCRPTESYAAFPQSLLYRGRINRIATCPHALASPDSLNTWRYVPDVRLWGICRDGGITPAQINYSRRYLQIAPRRRLAPPLRPVASASSASARASERAHRHARASNVTTSVYFAPLRVNTLGPQIRK